jgi:hypothetical protein
MSRHIWPLLIYGFLPLALARAGDAPLDVSPQPGVVLLRNGQVLSGKITQAGDDYYIALSSGEIRLHANQIDLVCRDLQEGYERKRSRLDPEKVADHLDLALWCLWQQLYENAAREIADARALDPRHPRIPLVERQLKLAQEQPSHNDRKVAGGAGPSTEDLDRLLRGMPPGTVEQFTNTVQPLLLNTCATSGCHGAQSDSKLKLLRTQLGKTASRRFTQRNLYSVVELIDRADPAASPLLTAPLTPHGTAKAPIFTNKDVVQYRQLVYWVMRVGRSGAEQPPNVEKPDDHLLQQLPQMGRAAPPQGAANGLLIGGPQMPIAPTEGARLPQPAAKSDSKKSLHTGTIADVDPPGDPFDASIFNERYAPKK